MPSTLFQVGGSNVSDWVNADVPNNAYFYDWWKLWKDMPNIFRSDDIQRCKRPILSHTEHKS